MTGRGKGEAPDAAGGPARHAPVLISAVGEALAAKDGEVPAAAVHRHEQAVRKFRPQRRRGDLDAIR
jgi:hypothetical protein